MVRLFAGREVILAEYRIGEVAEKCGIAPSAIRYYESEGLIPRAARRSGWRVYDEVILGQLALIDAAKCAGFTVAEIKKLLGGLKPGKPPGERWRGLMESKMEEIDERIAEAKRMKRVLRAFMGCHCPTITDCERALKSAKGIPT